MNVWKSHNQEKKLPNYIDQIKTGMYESLWQYWGKYKTVFILGDFSDFVKAIVACFTLGIDQRGLNSASSLMSQCKFPTEVTENASKQLLFPIGLNAKEIWAQIFHIAGNILFSGQNTCSVIFKEH